MPADASRQVAHPRGTASTSQDAAQPLLFGSRGSALALWQTNWVIDRLRATHPELTIYIETIRTQGDHTQAMNVPLTRFRDKSVFVAELEQALLAGEHPASEDAPAIDAAVHSLKDLSARLPDGLTLAAVTERGDPRDALVSRHGYVLETLPEGARVATSSVRRRAQLLHLRPDLRIEEIRGNVDTRVRKALDDDGPDAVVLAAAGLARLGLEQHITQLFATATLVPAAGQGALAVETRRGNRPLRQLLAAVDHVPSRQAARAERAVVAALGGGCRLPLGAYAEVAPNGTTLTLLAVVISPDGRRLVRSTVQGPASQPARLGGLAARDLRRQGATTILKAFAATSEPM